MHLQPASAQDWKLLLEWRNDIDARMNSQSMQFIPENCHRAWLDSVISSSNRHLYIAYENEQPIGTVRADTDPESGISELSWTTAPSARGRGFGKTMVKMLAEQTGGRLLAKIKPGNANSIKIAEHAGLKFSHEDNGILVYSNY